jgi:hypothetical protein
LCVPAAATSTRAPSLPSTGSGAGGGRGGDVWTAVAMIAGAAALGAMGHGALIRARKRG